MVEINLIDDFYISRDEYQYILCKRYKGWSKKLKYSNNLVVLFEIFKDIIMASDKTNITRFEELEKEILRLNKFIKSKRNELMKLVKEDLKVKK